MQHRPVRQRQEATAETAELEALAATSPQDKREMVATAEEAVPADLEVVASQAEQILTARQAATPVLEARVEQVERQPSEQAELVATAAQAVLQAPVELVPQRVTVGPVEMVRTVVPVVPVEAQAASTAMVAMVATVATRVMVHLVVTAVHHQQTTSQPAMVEPEATVELRAEPVEQQDLVPVLPELQERLGSVAMAEWVVPAAVQQSRVQISGQSVVTAELVEHPPVATAATVEQAATRPSMETAVVRQLQGLAELAAPRQVALPAPRDHVESLLLSVGAPLRRDGLGDLPVSVTTSAPGRNRTYDLRFRKPLLYPLSYGGEFRCRC